jgi:hypothetical protein
VGQKVAVGSTVAVGVGVAVAVNIGVGVSVEVGSLVAVGEGEGLKVLVSGRVVVGTAVCCAKDTGSIVTTLPRPSVVSPLLMAMVGTSVGGTFFTVMQALIETVTAARNKRCFFIA